MKEPKEYDFSGIDFETNVLKDYAPGDLFRKVKTADITKQTVNTSTKNELVKMTKEICSKIFFDIFGLFQVDKVKSFEI
jgi:hypothetical protein